MEEEPFSRLATWSRALGCASPDQFPAFLKQGFAGFSRALHCIAEQGRGDLSRAQSFNGQISQGT